MFRRELRALAVSGNSEALAGLVPYAMIFGFGAPSTVNVNDSHDLGTVTSHELSRLLRSATTRLAGPASGLRAVIVQPVAVSKSHISSSL